MNAIVFTGPTLPPEQAKRVLDCVFLPPAAQGDVYRAALEKPLAIGIIDGYFERVPAVSHKEILWAMTQGIHVFGAASMGALRAAELAPFGMEGIGEIYESFARGDLEDDDEVAVVHTTAQHGYRTLTVAMVDIRATLEEAERTGVIGQAAHRELLRIGKAMFYADRTYALLLGRAREEGIPGLGELQAFTINQAQHRKRSDAFALLAVLRDRLATGLAPKDVRYPFQHTDAWEYVRSNQPRPEGALR